MEKEKELDYKRSTKKDVACQTSSGKSLEAELRILSDLEERASKLERKLQEIAKSNQGERKCGGISRG